MLVYLLALGSPTFPVEPERMDRVDQHLRYELAGTDFGRSSLASLPVRPQYTQLWMDFRGIQDAYMRGRGLDYFENSRRAIYAQQAYAIANPLGWKDYGAKVWGITAFDGPADVELE